MCAARSGAGTSYVVRELALTMAGTGRSVLIADMDISRCDQYARFAADGAALSGPYDASYGTAPFWQVSPAIAGSDGQTTFGALYQCPSLGVSVTSFLWQNLRQGQSVNIARAPDYWSALRGAYNAVIIDVPALDRSDCGNTVFAYADSNVLIAPGSDAPDNHMAFGAITAAGGTCAGVIFNSLPQANAAAPPRPTIRPGDSQ